MNKKIEQLRVDFYEARAGQLYFKLKVDEQEFENNFNCFFNSLLSLKHWVEAISTGVQQASFRYSPHDIKFDFERMGWSNGIFSVSEAYENEKFFIKASVHRRQLIEALYLGLLTFANSHKYNPKEWEVECLKDQLCTEPNVDEETLVRQLLELGRTALEQLLKKFKAPYVEFGVPYDYDSLFERKKAEILLDCLNEQTNEYEGTSIDDFCSDIVEKYINEEV